jgi:hypothetical protein
MSKFELAPANKPKLVILTIAPAHVERAIRERKESSD